MKAAILEKYDKSGTDLTLQDIPTPSPEGHDVLVRMLYAGVNPLDNMIIRKEVKLIVDYRTPFVMGNEFVGIVEQVGNEVEDFQVGDRVYARMPLDSIGAFAEYAAIDSKAIAKVPEYLSDAEAACIPLTALTAWQSYALMDVEAGGKLFISGGTGSLGAMAVPIAKSLGLHVATNGNGKSESRMRSLGVDEFIDYRKQNFVEVLSDMDYVLDSLGEKALSDEFEILKPGGTLVSLRGLPNAAFARRMGFGLLKRLLFGMAGRKYDKMADKRGQTYQFIFVHSDGEDLAHISSIFERENVKPSIDEVFALEDVNAALSKVASGGSKGKTLLKIG